MRLPAKQSLSRRQYIYSGVVLLFFLLLLSGFVRLQVAKKDIYVQKSISNSIRKIDVYPVRGLIRDKNEKILVDNRPSFAAAVIPKVVSDSTIQQMSDIFQISLESIQTKMRKEFGFRPIIIARDINQSQLAFLEENRLSLPGVVSLVESKRFYAEDIRSPHIFGNIGEVTAEEQIQDPDLKTGDLTGKSGLEKEYDQELQGSKGVQYLRVDARGKEIGTYDANRNILPIHGNDLHLCMDYKLQQFADSLLEGQRGAIVALDTRNGDVLALTSKPDYNPGDLAGKIETEIWNNLLNDESHPLFSRSVQSTYPPGSVYKIVAAVAALEEGIITPHWKAHCPGYFQLGRKTIHCWNAAGHGTVDLKDAIKGSCNVYFYQLGLKIGLETWTKYSRMFAFGSKTEIDIPNETRGLVPSVEYFDKVFGKNGWTKGHLANLAIGQGELLTTPLQIAQFAMIIANKGVYHQPHLVQSTYQYDTKESISYPANTKYVTGVSYDTYDFIHQGMREVVNGGTGWLGKVKDIEMAGKTGSAQNPHGETHAWFMAFAPYENPEIAVAVLVENAGGGGAIAAPMARKFLEMYFYGKLIPRPVIKKDSTAVPEQAIDVLSPEILQPLPISIWKDSLQ